MTAATTDEPDAVWEDLAARLDANWRRLDAARSEVDDALAERRALFIEATEAGYTRVNIAAAAHVSDQAVVFAIYPERKKGPAVKKAGKKAGSPRRR